MHVCIRKHTQVNRRMRTMFSKISRPKIQAPSGTHLNLRAPTIIIIPRYKLWDVPQVLHNTARNVELQKSRKEAILRNNSHPSKL